MTTSPQQHKSQFGLLRERRFGPLFITQFCGAFNDNVFKNAMAIFVTFQAATITDMAPSLVVNLAAGLFILPFFLFSATAGQLADKTEKTTIIRAVKISEILIMAIGVVGFAIHSLPLLLTTLFLLGTHSTVFGPVKYSLLPQHLAPDEIVGGNGMIEFGTFLSILLGTILGGVVAADSDNVPLAIAIAAGVPAIIGLIAGWNVPKAPATDTSTPINWNPFSETARSLSLVMQNRTVYLSVLGISWFWLFGGTYLTQFPAFVRETLGGDAHVVTLLLALFSVGIGAGSLLCERLSSKRVEIGLVPFGALGLAIFSIDLYFASPAQPIAETATVTAMLQSFVGVRILFDLVLIGLFGGFFIVPLYALMQIRSPRSHQSRIIAGNNIFNAGFMVLGSLLAAALLHEGFTVPQLFLVTALLHVCVCVYIFKLIPEFLMRFLIWLLMHSLYRLRITNVDRIPEEGAAVLVCNHVSFVDALVLAAGSPRPVRFVTYYKVYRIPVLHFILKTGGAIPIAGVKEDAAMMEQAFADVAAALRAGELVCIFPEGRITDTGELYPFRSGITRILTETPVPVIPMALRGLWGSIFSRKHGAAFSRLSLDWVGSRVELAVGEPVPPAAATPEFLQSKVAELRGDWR